MRHLAPCDASCTGVQKLLVVMELQLLHNDTASFFSGHSISFPYFCFMHNSIFLMLSWSACLCNRGLSRILEGCASTERKTMSWIAGGLARVAARQPPASHQRGADDIPSDKSVKGEESTIAPPSKRGKVKANEQDSGHSGAETMWNGSVKDGPRRRSRGKRERCNPDSYWHHRRSGSGTILNFFLFSGGRKSEKRAGFAYLLIYLFIYLNYE